MMKCLSICYFWKLVENVYLLSTRSFPFILESGISSCVDNKQMIVEFTIYLERNNQWTPFKRSITSTKPLNTHKQMMKNQLQTPEFIF